MGAEVGATASTFPYTPNMRSYLEATGRSGVARAADTAHLEGFLSADEGAEYDEVIEIVRIPFHRINMGYDVALEFVSARTYHQWPIYARSCNSSVEIRRNGQAERMGGRNLCKPYRLLHK